MCSIAKSIREEYIYYNKSVHLQKENLTHFNTPMQDLVDTLFVCAITLNMRFLNSRK